MSTPKVSDVLIHLWTYVDQANYDLWIVKAFRTMPKKLRLEMLKSIIDQNDYDFTSCEKAELDEWIAAAKLILEQEESE